MKLRVRLFGRTGRLGGEQVLLVLTVQAVGPFLLCLAFCAATGIWAEAGSAPIRLLLLLLFCASMACAVLGAVWLWRPLAYLRELMEDWRRRKDLSRLQRRDSSVLEALFLEILQEQIRSMEREYKTEVLRQQAELMALQSQINPHFLYNTLDSIRGLAIRHQVPQIADMTEALSKLFRRMIAKEGMLITLSEELQSVDNYMLIQKFRFHNKFRYETLVEDDALLGLLVPNLIIQPIVENAIVHGLEKKREGGVVRIDAYATQNRLVIAVEDNGVGVALEHLDAINAMLREGRGMVQGSGKERMGIALSNINQRIKLRFGENYGVNIMSTQGISTTVEIVLPRILEEDGHG